MTKINVIFSDPQNLAGSHAAELVACAQAAANDWAALIASNATIDLLLNFTSSIGSAIAVGGSAYHYEVVPGLTIAKPDSVSKIVTGIDPNGATADLHIDMNTQYISRLFYDATETLAVPASQVDAVSVFTHEIGHGLGFSGLRNGTTGALSGSVLSSFDQFVSPVGGYLYFNGANAVRTYGGSVPLEFNNYGHIGNSGAAPGADLVTDLMYGTALNGRRVKISALDLAILEDTGLPVYHSGLSFNSSSSVVAVKSSGDFNHDGKADILWRNKSGVADIWNSSASGGFKGVGIGYVPPSWQIADTGDFNGDGRSDILWRDNNGATSIWTGSAAGGFVGTVIGYVDTSWQIAFVADFNGDGKSDILWRNSAGNTNVWTSNGAGGFAAIDLGVIDKSFKIAAVGDFNGDGKADIVWRNSNGGTDIWSSTKTGGYANVDVGYVSPDWQIVAVGDFNADHLTDLLWRKTGGATSIWNATAAGGFAGVDLGYLDLAWSVASVGDYNGDGTSDILWRNNNGSTDLWKSSLSGGFAASNLGSVDTSWFI